MEEIHQPDVLDSFTVYYYDGGMLIKSTLLLTNDNTSKVNHDVPITVIANERWGFKIFHGLSQHAVQKVDFMDAALARATVMMNELDNWVVFIPYISSAMENLTSDQIALLETIHTEKYQVYDMVNEHTPALGYFNFSNITFTYGLGVE